MQLKRLALLALGSLVLSSCSFAINFGSSSSSIPAATSLPPGPATKRTIRQTYKNYTTNDVYPIASAPCLGECRLLVVPIWFTDSGNYILDSLKEGVREDIRKSYFGTQAETGWHSVKSFYETESMGRLTINGVVSEWYEIGESVVAYTPDTDAVIEKTVHLATQAADWYFTAHPEEKRTDYDADKDGYLDGVMMIYAAPDYAARSTGENNLWAYCNWVRDTKVQNKLNPGVNQFFWASHDFMYGSNRATARTGKNYPGGNTSHCLLDAHTYIHEMGHVFGLDDYYDYGHNHYSPAAGFSMQDHNIGGHEAFSAMALGWADPYIPTQSCSITIEAFQKNHDCILLTPGWNQCDSPFDEYLLLELYTPTGLNALDAAYDYYGGSTHKGPNAVGIRLWHVDARLLYVESDAVFTASQMTSDADYRSYYGVHQAFSNTYDDEYYGTPLGRGTVYDQWNLLQLIRNNTSLGYWNKASLGSNDLFKDGSFFSMSAYGKQFARSGKLNSGSSLGWSFSVQISGSGDDAKATVLLTKE